MTASRERLGLLLCATAAVLWAISAVVARQIFDNGGSPLELSEIRAFVAAIAFALIARATREPRTVRTRARLPGLALLGIALASVNLTYYLAIQRLPVAIAVVIQYTAPGLVVAYELLIEKRRPDRKVVAGLVGVLLGVLLVTNLASTYGEVDSLDSLGVALAAASAVGFALYNLLAARVETGFGPVRTHAYGFGFASLIWLAIQIPKGVPETLTTAKYWPGILVVTLVGTVGAFGTYSAGIKRIGAAKASITSTLEPVAVAAFGALLLSQVLSVTQIIGSALVLISVWILKPRHVVVPSPGPGDHESETVKR